MPTAPLLGTRCLVNGRVQAELSESLTAGLEPVSPPSCEVVTASVTPLHEEAIASNSPLVYAPYQQDPLKHWARSPKISCENPLGKGALIPEQITIHEHGFSVQCARWNDGEQPGHLRDVERGKIGGFSAKSARRLRQHMLTNWGGANAQPFAVTLTTRQMHTPERWESAVKRFRTHLASKHPDWAACWRVELQKRKTPHLHCVFWIPRSDEFNYCISWFKYVITELWLKAIQEEGDFSSWQYAVSIKDLTGATGWVIYCTLHDSKHKKEQLGWKGRQWGIWNKRAWQLRPAVTQTTFTPAQRVTFCRRLRKHSRNRIRGQRSKPLRFYATRNISAFCMDAKVTAQLLRGIE